MRLVDIDDAARQEVRTFNAALEELLASGPSVHTVPPEETRQARVEGRGTFPAPVVVPEGRDESIPGPDGNDIRLRVFVPPGDVRGVYLHLHGGGWVLGSSHAQDPLLWKLANEAHVAVVSVDYRLAPEHPFPAGPDDCEAAARWLVERGPSLFGTDKIVIGGDSAGGHLAALTLVRLRDRHGITEPFVGANLVYGVFDLTMTPSQARWGDRNLVLSTPIMAWFYDCFLPGMPVGERRSGEVSPLYADLSGLPPALFTVGALDPLLDDTLFMSARWDAAGNDAELLVYPDAVHGFNGFPLAISAVANEAQWRFIEKAVSS
jgi:acetyl esterase/lipase